MSELRTLRKTWYQKLKGEGFEDIEDDHGNLLNYHFNICKMRYHPVSYEAKLYYYQEAGTLLHTHSFKSIEEREIWKLHSEGLPVRKIADRIKIYKKSWVHYIVCQIRKNIKGYR